MPSDKQLETRVRRFILRDSRLSGQSIDVAVTGGVVTLRGNVQSFRRGAAAVEIAASIYGVAGVVDELHIEPPGRVADEQIAEHVRRALAARADVTAPTIVVTVKNGVVALSGKVGNHWERLLAEDTALGTKGVTKVNNVLLVDLDEQIEDEALSREIQETLSYTRGLRDTNVRVAVADDTAVLTGDVPELWQKEIAEAVVRRFRVNRADNLVRVTG